MKAPAFDYVRPETLAEALAALAEGGEDARIIAGGQSLVPALNLRLQAPRLLVDIGRLAELRGVRLEGGRLRIGALTRHAEMLGDPLVAAHAPLLAEAATHMAHPAIRNRGTIGGSLAHADPASEPPACAVALGATIVVAGAAGERRVPADRFFRGVYETALGPGEILAAVEIPARPADGWYGLRELARRAGDYAIVGLALAARRDGTALRDVRPVFFAVGSRPVLAKGAAAAIAGRPVDADVVTQASAALAGDLAPEDDLQASAATRLHLARVLLRRALAEVAPGADVAERPAA